MQALTSARRLTANRPLAALVAADGVSAIGDWLNLTAIPLLVFRETHDVALVGLVAATRLLPWMLLSVPAGIVADRVPTPRLLLVSESSRALLMLLMTGLLLAGAPFWTVFLASVGAVVAATFTIPAQGALIPSLARDDAELGIANVVASAFQNIACVVGPAVAGILIAFGGLDVAFALNAASFIGMVGVMAWIVRRAPARQAVDALEATAAPLISATWPSIARAAARLLTMDAAISVAAGALSIVPILIVTSTPGTNEAVVGILSAAAGLGGLAGAVAAGKFVNGRPRTGLIIGIAVTATGYAALAADASILVTVITIALIAAALVQLDTLNMTEVQRSTPADRLGRTLGLLHSLAAGWIMAGSILAGAVGAAFGVGAAVVVCAVVVGLLGGAALIRPVRPVTTARLAEPVAG